MRRRLRSIERARVEAQVIALALANPPWGLKMLFYHLVGAGVEVGPVSMVWCVVKLHGLDRASYRYETIQLAMVLGIADEVMVPSQMHRPPIGRLDATLPGYLVQIDCFCMGRVNGI